MRKFWCDTAFYPQLSYCENISLIRKVGKLTVCNDEIMKNIFKKFDYKQNKSLNEFGELKAVFNARIPILKFVHISSGLKCDLSFSNRMALMNSKFIKKCLEVDSR